MAGTTLPALALATSLSISALNRSCDAVSALMPESVLVGAAAPVFESGSVGVPANADDPQRVQTIAAASKRDVNLLSILSPGLIGLIRTCWVETALRNHRETRCAFSFFNCYSTNLIAL